MKILDRLPFEATPTTVDTSVGPIVVRPYQIMVWVSLMTQDLLSRPFPAVLDTGANLNFIINETHLQSWLGLQGSQFIHRAYERIDGQKVPAHEATVLLHHNVRGTRTIARGSYQLSTKGGMVVYPKTSQQPRLPLLGLRAIVNSNLRVVVDGRRKLVSADLGRACESLRL